MPNIKYVAALIITVIFACAMKANAQQITNEQVFLGTRTDAAYSVFNGDEVYHVPQYMPDFPTAATIWPRVVQVDCVEVDGGDLKCEGYDWTPKLGRGEYLYFQPVIRKPDAPRTVIVEVPSKPKRQ